MKRGTVCWINLEDAAPPEFGKTRPAVIVSNSAQNEILDSVVVVPCSSQPPEIWPLRIELSALGKRRSYAVLPGIRQVSKARLLDIIDLLPRTELKRIDEGLKAYLGD